MSQLYSLSHIYINRAKQSTASNGLKVLRSTPHRRDYTKQHVKNFPKNLDRRENVIKLIFSATQSIMI